MQHSGRGDKGMFTTHFIAFCDTLSTAFPALIAISSTCTQGQSRNMPLIGILNIIGALSLLGYGIGSLFLPHLMARVIAQTLDTPRGVAEFRIVNGGYFTGLAAFALIVNQPLLYAALGVGWFGAAAGRLYAWLVDRPRFDSLYAGLLLFELAMGVLLVV